MHGHPTRGAPVAQLDAPSRDDPQVPSGRMRSGRVRSALADRSRTPALVGVATFLVVAAVLLAHNPTLFTVPVFEVGDAAANSLLVIDARSLDLLVGHYSRVGFNHPGPAVLYLQAGGELLFTDLLGVTPAPYNGQVLAVLLFQAATVAAVMAVLAAWHRRASVAAATLAAALVWFEANTWSLSSTWIPLVVIAPFLLLLVAAASVAAGRSRHLWLLALVGGLLVHAHVEFALFVPVLAAAAVGTWGFTRRLGPRALWQADPRAWRVALGLVALAVLPLVLNTLLNWPGEIPKYVGYSGAETAAGSPSLADALRYALQFWAPEPPVSPAVPVVVTAAAVAAALTAPARVRWPLVTLTAAAVLAEALVVLYALVGIDDLSQRYVGTFSLAVPLALALVVVVSLGARLAAWRPAAVALAVLAAGVGGAAATGDGVVIRSEGIHVLPEVAARVESAAAGTPVVLDVGEGTAAFVDGSGLLVHLEREGVPACVVSESLRVQLTPERMCSPQEVAAGTVVRLREPGTDPAPSFPGMQSEITVAP